MDYLIEIKKNTSTQDINNWNPNSDDNVTFKLLSDSSFQLFCEGIAIGKLRDIQINGNKITISIHNRNILTSEDKAFGEALPSILNSIFGLNILHASNKVIIENTPHTQDLRSKIGNYIWNNVKENKGVIQTGQKVYLISRHGYEIPKALRESVSPTSFPSFTYFRNKISDYLTGLRLSTISSKSEDFLFEWLFHAFENINDHAIFEYKNKKRTTIPIEGYRGILIQKIKLTTASDYTRNDLPVIVQNFIKQRIEDGEIGSELVINTLSVMDTGPGIQNTLEHTTTASDIDIINYAFQDGISSKNLNDKEKAGYGLGQVALASKQLNALFYVASGCMSAFYDFADDQKKQIPADYLKLNQYEDLNKECGTMLSVIWAHNPKAEDQLGLKV